MNYHINTIGIPINCFISAGGEHKRFTKKAWRAEVRKGLTLKGYAEWAQHSVQNEFVDATAPEVPHV